MYENKQQWWISFLHSGKSDEELWHVVVDVHLSENIDSKMKVFKNLQKIPTEN